MERIWLKSYQAGVPAEDEEDHRQVLRDAVGEVSQRLFLATMLRDRVGDVRVLVGLEAFELLLQVQQRQAADDEDGHHGVTDEVAHEGEDVEQADPGRQVQCRDDVGGGGVRVRGLGAVVHGPDGSPRR